MPRWRWGRRRNISAAHKATIDPTQTKWEFPFATLERVGRFRWRISTWLRPYKNKSGRNVPAPFMVFTHTGRFRGAYYEALQKNDDLTTAFRARAIAKRREEAKRAAQERHDKLVEEKPYTMHTAGPISECVACQMVRRHGWGTPG